MKYSEGVIRLADYRRRVGEIRKAMRSLQTEIEPQRVEDYVFATSRGAVRLSELFAGNEFLFIIHSMGSKCPYCTLWADGYNGIYRHLKERASFYVSSPDSPDTQSEFAKSRGWVFPMISHAGTDFAKDMGYRSGKQYKPGISVFKLIGGVPHRVSDASSFPWDDFSPLWHLFDLIPDQADDWQPKLSYC